MKAEINNENKAKFFALYWGQRVGKRWVETGSIETKTCLAQDGHLLHLKPLSSISDEDAINYFDILCHKNHKNKPDEFKIDYGKEWANNILSERFGLIPANLIYGYDYLRSKGYALPWMGLTVDEMVDSGWIKLTEL